MTSPEPPTDHPRVAEVDRLLRAAGATGAVCVLEVGPLPAAATPNPAPLNPAPPAPAPPDPAPPATAEEVASR